MTATIATLGLESFNADTNSNYELVTMVPVDCATSDLDEPNCIGTRGYIIQSTLQLRDPELGGIFQKSENGSYGILSKPLQLRTFCRNIKNRAVC